MAADRSVTDVLQNILRNVQDILRSEIRLANAETRQEATQAGAAVLISAELRRFARIKPVPERTIASLQENLKWMKQPTK